MSVLKIKDSKTGEWINVPYISGGLSPELKDYATEEYVDNAIENIKIPSVADVIEALPKYNGGVS